MSLRKDRAERVNTFLQQYPNSRALILINTHTSADYGQVIWSSEEDDARQAPPRDVSQQWRTKCRPMLSATFRSSPCILTIHWAHGSRQKTSPWPDCARRGNKWASFFPIVDTA